MQSANIQSIIARRDDMQRVEHNSRLQTMPKPARPAAEKDTVTYSIVAPVFNEEETLPHFYESVIAVMQNLAEPFELLFINDGSRDGSFRIMQELHEKDPRVHVVNFSRNFGHQIAISAGLD